MSKSSIPFVGIPAAHFAIEFKSGGATYPADSPVYMWTDGFRSQRVSNDSADAIKRLAEEHAGHSRG